MLRKNGRNQSESDLIGSMSVDTRPPRNTIPDLEYVCLMNKIIVSQYPSGASYWIVDSGRTAHMTFDRSLFASFISTEEGNVEMGTKETAKVSDLNMVILRSSSTLENKSIHANSILCFTYQNSSTLCYL